MRSIRVYSIIHQDQSIDGLDLMNRRTAKTVRSSGFSRFQPQIFRPGGTTNALFRSLRFS